MRKSKVPYETEAESENPFEEILRKLWRANKLVTGEDKPRPAVARKDQADKQIELEL